MTSPTVCALAAPNCSPRQRTSAADQRRLRQAEQPSDLERRGQAHVLAAVGGERAQLVAHVDERAVVRIPVGRQRTERASVPGGGRIAAARRLRQRDVPGLGQLGRLRAGRCVRIGQVDVLDLLGGVGAVRVDREHGAVLRAEEADVERLHDRTEVALVGGHERPVGQHREAVRLLQHERKDVDGPAARHLLADRHARVGGLKRGRLGRRRRRWAGPVGDGGVVTGRGGGGRVQRSAASQVRGRLRVVRVERCAHDVDRVAGAHDDQVGAGRGRSHEAEVLDGRDEVEGVVGGELGVGRQRVDLAFEVDQAGQVANGRGHQLSGVRVGLRDGDRQPVGEDDGQPAVVVAVGQLGVADVHLAHVDQQR